MSNTTLNIGDFMHSHRDKPLGPVMEINGDLVLIAGRWYPRRTVQYCPPQHVIQQKILELPPRAKAEPYTVPQVRMLGRR